VRMPRPGDKRADRRRRRGYSLVEVAIASGILVSVLGAFVAALEGSSQSLATGCAKGLASARLEQALHRLEADCREASQSLITRNVDGLPVGQCAIALPCARDSEGSFHVTSSFQTAWQGVIVYCPYVTAEGVTQLRRYVYYSTSYSFPFTFVGSPPVTSESIMLQDALGCSLEIDRQHGNTSLPVGERFTVVCPGLIEWDIVPGALTTVSLNAGCGSRRGLSTQAEGIRYVAHRN